MVSIRVTEPKRLFANAEEKASLFRDRFELIKQRLLRNEAFRPPSFAAGYSTYFHITPISHLKGKPPGRFLLFGMLTQMQQGKVHLEDPDAFIELEFPQSVRYSVLTFIDVGCNDCW
jgi:DNA polymerase epsilon subunit 2